MQFFDHFCPAQCWGRLIRGSAYTRVYTVPLMNQFDPLFGAEPLHSFRLHLKCCIKVSGLGVSKIVWGFFYIFTVFEKNIISLPDEGPMF